MKHKVRKSTSRKKVISVALSATALANAGAGMLGLDAADAATQSWINMCVQYSVYLGIAQTSDVYVVNPAGPTRLRTGCRTVFVNAISPPDWWLIGGQGPRGALGP